MRGRSARILVVLLAILSVPLACSLPGQATPTPSFFFTPNGTMTALFAPTVLIYPSDTPPATFIPPSPEVDIQTPLAVTPADTPLTATEAGASGRPGPNVTASFLNAPPTIDGDWNDWSTPAYPAQFEVFGAQNWQGPDDLEGSFRIGWDATYLYLAVKVKDDVYVQEATGVNLFKGDSLEVLLDNNLSGDLNLRQLDNDDFQLGISPGYQSVNNHPEAYLWFPSSLAGSRPQVKIAAIGSQGVYRVEAAIPWIVFNVTPSSGQQYGFALSASDDDTPGTQQQQSMVSNISTRVLADPTTWGTLTLK